MALASVLQFVILFFAFTCHLSFSTTEVPFDSTFIPSTDLFDATFDSTTKSLFDAFFDSTTTGFPFDGTFDSTTGSPFDPFELSSDPTINPTVVPTTDPTTDPTIAPSADALEPTLTPTLEPTISTEKLTDAPTTEPTLASTSDEFSDSTTGPTMEPTAIPTLQPTSGVSLGSVILSNKPPTKPSKDPSNKPSKKPKETPTNAPSSAPSSAPSTAPTNAPTIHPTKPPKPKRPKNPPTESPTKPPGKPSRKPKEQPTNAPTNSPTIHPTKPKPKRPKHPPTESPTKPRKPKKPPTDAPTLEPTLIPTSNPTVNPTTQSPTTSAQYCAHADYHRSRYITKSNDFVLLSQNESIVSLNCLFMLKLEFSGNLRLFNTITNEQWSTNTSIDIENDTDTSIVLTLLDDHLYVWAESNDTSAHDNILWEEHLTNIETNDDHDLRYQLYITDDRCVILYREIATDNKEIIELRSVWSVCVDTDPFKTTAITESDEGTNNLIRIVITISVLIMVLLCCIVLICLWKFVRKGDHKLQKDDTDTPGRAKEHEVAMNGVDLKAVNTIYEEDEQIQSWILNDNDESQNISNEKEILNNYRDDTDTTDEDEFVDEQIEDWRSNSHGNEVKHKIELSISKNVCSSDE
mmetsp:Transcript_43636/g.38857  ORF Transcript_43636/g.38857 Transcript_43636/m.38857 type:complete len:633 (+) Transcript_43636:25-1923(+)